MATPATGTLWEKIPNNQRHVKGARSMTLGTKTIDTTCPSCDARAGERCSDTGVFVRDTAFHRERLSTAVRTTKDANLKMKRQAALKEPR
jgi:hypothetical protein